jgi:hypothetical protein
VLKPVEIASERQSTGLAGLPTTSGVASDGQFHVVDAAVGACLLLIVEITRASLMSVCRQNVTNPSVVPGPSTAALTPVLADWKFSATSDEIGRPWTSRRC